jgi:4-hydroxybenzoate polyprenyltransferase
MSNRSVKAQLRGLIRLTRWKEYVPFVIPLTVVGALLAVRQDGEAFVDWRLIMVTAANVLAVAYAFMINDIEDAPDDARDPDRAARNPVSSGEIGVRFGYNACRAVAAVTLILYAFGGLYVLGIGIATLLLSHFYSWRPVRLKAYPITDIVSHSLMLSGLLLLAGYFVYHTQPGVVWFVASSMTLISVYGQLYNQLRDFEMDKAAGLFNTAIVLGETNTRWAMYVTIALAGGCMLAAIVLNAFPLWLAFVLPFSFGVSIFFRSNTDMRGSQTVDVSGSYQMQGLIVGNVTVIVWLLWVVVAQMISL